LGRKGRKGRREEREEKEKGTFATTKSPLKGGWGVREERE